MATENKHYTRNSTIIAIIISIAAIFLLNKLPLKGGGKVFFIFMMLIVIFILTFFGSHHFLWQWEEDKKKNKQRRETLTELAAERISPEAILKIYDEMIEELRHIIPSRKRIIKVWQNTSDAPVHSIDGKGHGPDFFTSPKHYKQLLKKLLKARRRKKIILSEAKEIQYLAEHYTWCSLWFWEHGGYKYTKPKILPGHGNDCEVLAVDEVGEAYLPLPFKRPVKDISACEEFIIQWHKRAPHEKKLQELAGQLHNYVEKETHYQNVLYS